jgi:hypothetical protein
MRKARSAFGVLSLRPPPLGLLGALALWLGLGWLNPALARTPYDDMNTTERWAWSNQAGRMGRLEQALPQTHARSQEERRCALAEGSPPAFCRTC